SAEHSYIPEAVIRSVESCDADKFVVCIDTELDRVCPLTFGDRSAGVTGVAGAPTAQPATVRARPVRGGAALMARAPRPVPGGAGPAGARAPRPDRQGGEGGAPTDARPGGG